MYQLQIYILLLKTKANKANKRSLHVRSQDLEIPTLIEEK